MGFLPYFLSICLYVDSMVLSGHVHMAGTMGYVLSAFHLWPIHQQFHCLVFLNVL